MENDIFVTPVSCPAETITHPNLVNLVIGSPERPILDPSCIFVFVYSLMPSIT